MRAFHRAAEVDLADGVEFEPLEIHFEKYTYTQDGVEKPGRRQQYRQQ